MVAELNRWYDVHGKWQKWFAWYPVRCKNEWCWLKTVYRRKLIFTEHGVDTTPPWHYGTVFDILSKK